MIKRVKKIKLKRKNNVKRKNIIKTNNKINKTNKNINIQDARIKITCQSRIKTTKNNIVIYIQENGKQKNKRIQNSALSKIWNKYMKMHSKSHSKLINNQNNQNNSDLNTNTNTNTNIIKKIDVNGIHYCFGIYQKEESSDYPYQNLEKILNQSINYINDNKKITDQVIVYVDTDLLKERTPIELMINKLYESFYTFSYFKTMRMNNTQKKNKKNPKPFTIIVSPMVTKDQKKLADIVNYCVISSRGKEIGRDLENYPSNYLYPEKYAELVRTLIKPIKKCSIKIFNHHDLLKRGFHTILAVGQGSIRPPALVELTYKGSKKNDKPIILVGKGITFDSGGLNLKHSDFSDMKMDKTGASVALSVFMNLAKLKIKKNIIALLPLAENMPDGGAIRPGDVIRSYSGKTVEITNTDAEGRLVLCDALAYAQEKNPELIVDVATLTGAAEHLTNGQSAVYLGNNVSREWRQKLEMAKRNTQEKIFELPLWNDWKPYLHSTIADIKNTAYDAHADIFLSSLFLSYFVDKRVPWIHIDLANNYPDKIKNGSMVYPSARGSSILLLTNLLSK